MSEKEPQVCAGMNALVLAEQDSSPIIPTETVVVHDFHFGVRFSHWQVTWADPLKRP